MNKDELNKYKKYNRTLLTVFLGIMIFTAGLNYIVNPYNIFRVPTFKLTALKPEAKLQERVTKYTGLKLDRRKVNAVFLGTSRADYALNPDYYEAITDNVMQNMGMGGMIVEEYIDALDLILKIHPEINNVYMGLDFIMFAGNSVFDEASKAKTSGNPNLEPSELCTALISFSATRDSVWTIVKNILGIKSRMYNADGTKYTFVNKDVDKELNIAVNQFKVKYDTFDYNPEKLNVVRYLKDYCDKKGINLYIFIMPTHIIDMQMMKEYGLWDDFQSWKRDLVGISPVFDFQYPNEITTEKISPDMKYFFEISHATSLTGNIILERIILGKGDFGRLNTPENVDEYNKKDTKMLLKQEEITEESIKNAV